MSLHQKVWSRPDIEASYAPHIPPVTALRNAARKVKPNKNKAAIALRCVSNMRISADGTQFTHANLTPGGIYLGVAVRNLAMFDGFILTDDMGKQSWFSAKHFHPVNPARLHLFPHLSE